MPNQIYNDLNSTQAAQNGATNIVQAFQQFMMQNKGKDPNEIKNQMVSSLGLTQDQLNQAQQIAKQFEDKMSGFKSMFGFN